VNPVRTTMLAVATRCDELKLPYFVTGSVAAMAWGEPRHTLDVDIVVELSSSKVNEFCQAFAPPGWYVSEDAAHEAAQRSGQFNTIFPEAGVKADIIAFRDTPLNNSRLFRAREVEFDERRVMFASPEDVILKRLRYFREGESDKHLRDCASILKVSGAAVDLEYIEEWALRTSVASEWLAIKQRLGMV